MFGKIGDEFFKSCFWSYRHSGRGCDHRAGDGGRRFAVISVRKLPKPRSCPRGEQIPAAVVGEVVPGSEGYYWVTQNDLEKLRPPEVDLFWAAFFGVLEKKEQQKGGEK